MTKLAIKASLSAIGAALAAYFHTVAIPIAILVVVMICDYLTGMTDAIIHAELSSEAGWKGIVKKLCYFFAVIVGFVVDWCVASFGEQLGADIHNIHAVALLVIVWLIVNECISIIENLHGIGVPLPGFLAKIVKRIKDGIDKKGDELSGDDEIEQDEDKQD